MKKLMWRAVAVLLIGAGVVRAQAPEDGPVMVPDASAPVRLPQTQTQTQTSEPIMEPQIPALPVAQEDATGKDESIPAPNEKGKSETNPPAKEEGKTETGLPGAEDAPVLTASKESGSETPCAPGDRRFPRCRKVLEWLTYRPQSCRCLCNCRPQCKPCGMPPLYTFFLCDRYNYPPQGNGCATCGAH